MKKSIFRWLLWICILAMIPAFSGCGDAKEPAGQTEEETETNETQESEEMGIPELTVGDNIQVVLPNRPTSFSLICSRGEALNIENAHTVILNAVQSTLNVKMKTSSSEDYPNHILVGVVNSRPETKTLNKTLQKDEYAICTQIGEDGHVDILIGYNGSFAMLCAIDRFCKEYVLPTGLVVPKNLDIRGTCTMDDVLISTPITKLRDPFILLTDDGTYYAYGTGWVYYKNTSGSLSGAWDGPFSCVEAPEDYADNPWAPEVHFYKGSYYMLTTYRSKTTDRRGCTIFKASSPEGPFVPHSDGFVTPGEWDSIDGTLYVDPEGTPWMVFVHEWVSAPENTGRMAAVRLTDDLSAPVGEATELFKATDPSWSKEPVTDGCFLFKTEKDRLGMIWSNWDDFGYCVGMAFSSDGTLSGKWKQDDRVLFSKTKYGTYDGGHGMLFADLDGQWYLSMHCPNGIVDSRLEVPTFLPVRFAYDTLVPDVWHPES